MPVPPPISSVMIATTRATAAATRRPVATNGAALGTITVTNLRRPRSRSTVAVSRTTGSTDLTP